MFSIQGKLFLALKKVEWPKSHLLRFPQLNKKNPPQQTFQFTPLPHFLCYLENPDEYSQTIIEYCLKVSSIYQKFIWSPFWMENLSTKLDGKSYTNQGISKQQHWEIIKFSDFIED